MQSPIWSYQFAAAFDNGTLKIDLLDGQGQSVGPCAEAVLDTDGNTLQSLWGTPATFRAYSPQGALIECDVPFYFRTGASYANALQSPAIIDGAGPVFPAGKYLISGAARNGIIEPIGVAEQDSNGLADFCLIALTADATVVVEILDANNKTVAAGTITVATAAAKSAEVLITAGLGSYSSTYKKMLIISMSGGLVFWNRAGTGVPGTGNGVGTPAPTSTNALPLLPGMVLG